MPWKTRYLGWFVAPLLGVGVAAWIFGGTKSAPAPKYETDAIVRGDISARVIATGTLSPLVTVSVGSQVSGRILELHADFNSQVNKGDVIARIDPSLFKAELARANANLAAARAALKKAQAEHNNAKLNDDRYVVLGKKNLVAQADVDTARSGLLSAEAQIGSAEAAVAQANAAVTLAETNLTYTNIVSPIDGVVIARSVDLGQTVAASFQAPTLFTIAEDPRKMEVHTNVAESDVGRVQAGQAVEFTVDAFPTKTFLGAVKEVRYSPQTLQNVVTYDAVVSVENPELELRPGMTADVTFMVEAHSAVLLVPSAALRFRPPSEKAPAKGGPMLWTLAADGSPHPLKIELGLSDGQRTEVSGAELSEGDVVILGLKTDNTKKSDGRSNQQRFGRFL